MSERVTITIDGVPQEADAGQLLIAAAEENGTYIPRFCWHNRMNPVGMCRMCLVEIDGPRGRMLVPSCTQPVSDGMVVHTDSETVKKAQEGVLEFLLLNHPLDCPVCDKGGECPLQDQTLSHGPGDSRFVEDKRHFEKPIPISDLVLLDRERCILCARCVRFSDEISGDPLIEFMDRGSVAQVNTFPEEPFSSYFSGNTVQICPVGALTATAYRFRARPWDLREVASVNPLTTSGDSITVQASQNQVLRYLGVDNDHTNHGWLDDRSRFGFQWLSSEDRLETPLVKAGDGHATTTWGEALAAAAEQLTAVVDEHGPGAVAAIGGSRGTNEDAYALATFMRQAIGSPNLDARLDDGLGTHLLTSLAGKGRIGDLESAKTVLVWAADLKEEHPTLYLRVRRAAQELGATLITVHPTATGLADRATMTLTYRPGEGRDLLDRLRSGAGDLADARRALDEGPVVAIVGRTGLAEDPGLAEAVAAFARDLPGASVLPVVRRANTYGALDMGVAPDLLPGRVAAGTDAGHDGWSDANTDVGLDTRGILEAAADGRVKALLLVGADPLADVPDHDLAVRAFDAVDLVVSLDCFMTESTARADIVLPALGFAEKEGTVTNLEGRVMKVNRIVPGPGQAREDWSILDELAQRMGRPLDLGSAEAISQRISAHAPAYEGISWFLLDWKERDGVVAPREGATQPLQYIPTGGLHAVGSGGGARGGFALHLARVLYDDAVLTRHGPSIADLAPGPFAALNPADADRIGANGRVEVDGHSLPLRRDPSLAEGTVFVPFNQPGGPRLGGRAHVDVSGGRS
jgi:NADH-quinone oxidoreductase subunit G